MKTEKTVHVVGSYKLYERMFINHGWTVVDCVEDADLVQFCGGEDVWPGLYGESINSKTHYNLERDRYEKKIYELAVSNRCAIAGICRGAQFVHVMNGGKLYQHVDSHAISGVHIAYVMGPVDLIPEFKDGIWVSSTHHQQMDDTRGEVILASFLSQHKENGDGEIKDVNHYAWDVEAVYHPHSRSFCYQPHPEFFKADHPCQVFYFKALKSLLFPNRKQIKEAS